MPYLIGRDAVRRTIKYLEQGRLIFRKNVKVMTVCFNAKGDYYQGARDFVYWNLCQVMYKNPDVQVLQYKDKFPSSFVRCWLDTGEDVIMDAFGKSNKEILDHLIKVLGQPQSEKDERKTATDSKKGICNFGSGCLRHCICEIPGQFPCPCVVQIPKHMTGKYILENNLHPPKGLYRAF